MDSGSLSSRVSLGGHLRSKKNRIKRRFSHMFQIGSLLLDSLDHDKGLSLITAESTEEYFLLTGDKTEAYEKSYVNHYFEPANTPNYRQHTLILSSIDGRKETHEH